MKKRNILYISVMMFFLLVGCSNGESIENEISNHLEESVNLEEKFKEQQSHITELEEQEQAIYEEILDLSMDDFDEIKSLSNDAIEVLEELGDTIEIEEESLVASKEEFEKIKPLIEDLEEEATKEKAEELYEMMEKRFSAYDNLNEAYMASLEAGEELYLLVQDEDATQDDLSEQVTVINGHYDTILDENDAFNTHTDSFNELKQEFYDVAGIETSSEED